MDFELSEEQRMIQKMAQDFAEKEIKPVARELDRTERHPSEIIEKLAELSLMGIAVPEEYGGGGADCVSYALAIEEICRVSAGIGTIMLAHNTLTCFPIQTFGTEGQKKRFLTPLAKGEKLGCYALTEPQAG